MGSGQARTHKKSKVAKINDEGMVKTLYTVIILRLLNVTFRTKIKVKENKPWHIKEDEHPFAFILFTTSSILNSSWCKIEKKCLI